MSSIKKLIQDLELGNAQLEKGEIDLDAITTLKSKAQALYDKLTIISYKLIEMEVKQLDEHPEKIIKEIERKERLHQETKNQTNLISAIQEQEVINEGYSVSEKGLSFEDLLFENESSITDTVEAAKSSSSTDDIDLFGNEKNPNHEESTPDSSPQEEDKEVIASKNSFLEPQQETNNTLTEEKFIEETVSEEEIIEDASKNTDLKKITPAHETITDKPAANDQMQKTEVAPQENNIKTSSINEQLAEKNSTPSLAEKLAIEKKEEQEKEIAKKMQKDAIDDLKRAISINQKFIFINDLFNGEVGVYNDMIDQINNSGDKTAAETLMKAISQEYSWDNDSASVINFIDLVERRFS